MVSLNLTPLNSLPVQCTPHLSPGVSLGVLSWCDLDFVILTPVAKLESRAGAQSMRLNCEQCGFKRNMFLFEVFPVSQYF